MNLRDRALRPLLVVVAGCADAPPPSSPSPGADGGPALDGAVASELSVVVPSSGGVDVRLDAPAITGADGPWDVRFSGWDVFTHGGASGGGAGGAFGPLDPRACAADAPTLPIVIRDHAGGAFEDWYAYDGTTHALHSRFHVYGVRDATHTYKVQILSYYGEVAGAPTSAVYRVRWADARGGPTRELATLDATAGGASGAGPSACLDLGTGVVAMHTTLEASTATDWHLCFRRDAITVNGERGGPRGVGAVDADFALREGETLATVSARTADSERPRFDRQALDDPTLVFRGDRVLSAFSDAWFARTVPRAPLSACWVVVGHDGATRYGLLFDHFLGASDASPGTVTLHVRRF